MGPPFEGLQRSRLLEMVQAPWQEEVKERIEEQE